MYCPFPHTHTISLTLLIARISSSLLPLRQCTRASEFTHPQADRLATVYKETGGGLLHPFTQTPPCSMCQDISRVQCMACCACEIVSTSLMFRGQGYVGHPNCLQVSAHERGPSVATFLIQNILCLYEAVGVHYNL
jgi:hypothetical protein